MTPYNFIKSIKIFLLIPIVFIQLNLSSCIESEYSKLVHAEMAKNISNDELVFDLRFGNTRQEFFDRCWELNRQKLVDQGPNNNFVEYILKPADSTDAAEAISMLFYGSFNEENIMTGMDMEFSYVAWAPWNNKLQAEELIPAIQDTLLDWYPGNKFIPLQIKELNKEAFVKVDGNRQITVYTKNTKDVVVKISDLNHKYPSKLNKAE